MFSDITLDSALITTAIANRQILDSLKCKPKDNPVSLKEIINKKKQEAIVFYGLNKFRGGSDE